MKIRDRIKELRRVPASELAPSPRNWRTHPKAQQDALRGVLAEIGIADALLARELADGTLELIDGHCRAEIMPDAIVPVLILDVDANEAGKILATLDPLAAMANADADKLQSLINEISFDNEAIKAMLAQLAEQHHGIADEPPTGDGGDAFDATPDASVSDRCTLGDTWLIGGMHRLVVGDCTDPTTVARLMAGDQPRLMVTDPPYGVEYDPTWRHRAGVNHSPRTGRVANDNNADWTLAWRWFTGDIAYVYHGALHSALVYQSLVEAGLKIRSQIVWVKPRLVLSRGHYHWKHEPAFFASKEPDPSASNDEPISAETAWYAVRSGSNAAWKGGRKQTTVWEIDFSGEPKTFHGTQKPVECMARPIRNHGIPGNIVYDPFLGSGTTLIAAHRTRRRCYGCELDPCYAEVILRRAEAEGLTCQKVENF